MKRTAAEVAEAMYELFKAWPELLRPPMPQKMEERHELTAVTMLIAIFSSGDLAAFHRADEASKSVGSALMVDFLGKLMGPLSNKNFEAPAELTGPALARYVCAQEILRGHPQLQGLH